VANHAEIAEYFNWKGVSAIFLFRRNLLRQLVSQLSNNHDRHLRQLNGTHKAHVHTRDEVVLFVSFKSG
jgi:Ni,Fe-hydrogenase III component G